MLPEYIDPKEYQKVKLTYVLQFLFYLQITFYSKVISSEYLFISIY